MPKLNLFVKLLPEGKNESNATQWFWFLRHVSVSIFLFLLPKKNPSKSPRVNQCFDQEPVGILFITQKTSMIADDPLENNQLA